MQWKRLLIVLAILIAVPAMPSIIKKPPVKPPETDPLYKELVCTDQDRANIYEIISTIGENGKLSLLFKQSHLKELGAKINHVHPLKFLAVIFTDSHLKTCMFSVWDDYFKRTHFLDGLGPSLTREAEKEKLNQYLGDFATELKIPLENLRPYFDMRDWESLVLYLIHF